MKNFKANSLLVLLFLALFTFSCGGDDDDAVDCTDTAAYETAFNTWLEDTINFTNDESADNCAALKSSSTTLRNLTVQYESCFESSTDYNEAIDGIDQILAALDC